MFNQKTKINDNNQLYTLVVVITFIVIISFMSYELGLQVASCIKMWVDLKYKILFIDYMSWYCKFTS